MEIRVEIAFDAAGADGYSSPLRGAGGFRRWPFALAGRTHLAKRYTVAPGSSMLVVDRLEETGEVLRTAFERRGVRVLSTRTADEGLELARSHEVDLVILDVEDVSQDAAEISGETRDILAFRDTPMIVLGSVRRRPDGWPDSRFVAKPYHYAPLIRKIEALLVQARRAG